LVVVEQAKPGSEIIIQIWEEAGGEAAYKGLAPSRLACGMTWLLREGVGGEEAHVIVLPRITFLLVEVEEEVTQLLMEDLVV